MNDQPPPTEQQVFSSAYVDALKAQRNAAMDAAADMAGRLAVAEHKLQALQQQMRTEQ